MKEGKKFLRGSITIGTMFQGIVRVCFITLSTKTRQRNTTQHNTISQNIYLTLTSHLRLGLSHSQVLLQNLCKHFSISPCVAAGHIYPMLHLVTFYNIRRTAQIMNLIIFMYSYLFLCLILFSRCIHTPQFIHFPYSERS